MPVLPETPAEQEREVRAALNEQPDHPALLAALGVLCLQRGAADEAVLHLDRAVRLGPGEPAMLSDFAAALLAVGRSAEAEVVLRAALGLGGADDNVLFNLARTLHRLDRPAEALDVLAGVKSAEVDVLKLRATLSAALGDWQGAAAAYLAVLQQLPDDAVCMNDLGVLLETHGKREDFVALWQSLATQGDATGVVHFFLGNALRDADRLPEAVAAYETAVARAPGMSEALNNLALVQSALGDEVAALATLRRAAELNPDLAAPQANLGAAMSRTPALDEAATLLSRAVAADPDCLDARVNYGAVLMRQRHHAAAEREFRHVLARRPDDSAGRLNLGLLLLTEGRLSEGWPYYEARWEMQALRDKRPCLDTPLWTGEPLDGRTLFVFSEQGFGDNLQFVRYFAVLQARYPTLRIIYYAMHALARLFAESGLGPGVSVVRWGDPIPPHDANIPLLSLPWRLGTTIADIPAFPSYLRADPVRQHHWSGRLPGGQRKRVGLVWASSETFIYRSAKTIALSLLAPLIEAFDCQWVNLQFGPESGEIVDNAWSERIFDPMAEVADFADTAAVVANLDLIISVDTAVAHLAGALGRPVWMLDRFDTDWRWLPPREDSPWYPTMRIFRQSRHGHWDDVVARLVHEIRAWLDDQQANQGEQGAQ